MKKQTRKFNNWNINRKLLKENILKILDTLGVKSARTKNIVENISISFFYKGGSILASLLLVPLIINYLDTTNYGIWLIITSFISWFTFFVYWIRTRFEK
ncbi:hypothetical protein A9996_15410 [Gelidibacter algens]|nr:hypothetical protein A9996_15410 [Gelidibacter algens]